MLWDRWQMSKHHHPHTHQAAWGALAIPRHWTEWRSTRADTNHICHHPSTVQKKRAELRKSTFNICIINRKLVSSNSTFCCNCCLQKDERRPPEKHRWEAWMIIINSWINLILYPVERYKLIWELHLRTLLSKHQQFQNAKAHWEAMFRCFSHWKLKREWYLFYISTCLNHVCTNLQKYHKDRFPPEC